MSTENDLLAQLGAEVRKRQEHEIALMQKRIDEGYTALSMQADELLDALFARHPGTTSFELRKPLGIYVPWDRCTVHVTRLEAQLLPEKTQEGVFEVTARDRTGSILYVGDLPVSDKIEIIHHLRLAQGDDV